ncbi:cytochrome P450 [Chaetoceros tenuissimus]|uniref:Cytochrome P450 n=1 Tax=Chaetoceros tenuissimus TaxID=426638 RepID=A0AAD3CI25_9STRA|nr:cytochrome P450 [Chaetoceros tenuissimus]
MMLLPRPFRIRDTATSITLFLCIFAAVCILEASAFSTRSQRLHTTPKLTRQAVTEESTEIISDKDRIASLPLPPHRSPGPFRGIRESISHLTDGKRFARKRAEELGDVFLTNVFFKPTVIIGGQEAITEFVSGTELKSKVIHAALPDTFKELHTKWGTLNLDSTDTLHKEARSLFSEIFSVDALESYLPVIEESLEMYVQSIVERIKKNPQEEIQIVQELKELCLQIFSKLFSGAELTKEQVQMFDDYNSALLALPFEKKKIEKGRDALKTLKSEMLSRYKDCQAGTADPASAFYSEKVQKWFGYDEDRVCTATVLFIWGAYIECAALMTNALTIIKNENPDYIEIIAEEYQTQLKSDLSLSDLEFWSNMQQTLGVLRESLRLIPPAGGATRYSDEDFEFRGYRIPAGTAVMMDPRVGNTDPKLFTEPDEFLPLRWVPSDSSTSSSSGGCPLKGTALKLGFGSWFPGGFGAHQCPGIPLAELTSKIFLGKVATAFDNWSFDEVKYVEVPIKIPTDNFAVTFSLRN